MGNRGVDTPRKADDIRDRTGTHAEMNFKHALGRENKR